MKGKKRTPLFDDLDKKQHIGGLKTSKELNKLYELECYFIDKCREYNMFWSYDLTGNEPYNFKTINYATYAGFFIMHPLQPEITMKQMYDARIDNIENFNYVSYIKKKIYNDNANKYLVKKENQNKRFEAIVVLPGENKIKESICIDKCAEIIKTHGKNVVFKVHPLTNKETIENLCEIIKLPWDQISGPDGDLYSILRSCNYVYSTHLSESALYAAVLNKKLSPIDVYCNRILASFTHINYFLYGEIDNLKWINKTFSSYKSGILDPNIHSDWKQRMDSYFEYIINIRKHVKNFFIQE
jgi:hypothetical protein